jgi:decaprenylphospho-beta-D-erythro-pentofuranosid-2-ulose 2-reductase
MKDALGSVQSMLVVGGGSDIAQATVRRLVADRTRNVVLAARDTQRLEPFVQELRESGAATAELLPFEAAADDPGSAVDAAFERHGDIDVVLVAFGVLGDDEAAREQPDTARHILEINFTSAALVCVAAARRLRAQGHGTLVVMSSVAGERVRRSNFVYGASKAGIDAFAQGMGDWLHGTGVRVLVVRPGFVRTKMTAGRKPAPLSTTAEAVADAIADGLRRDAHTIWVPRSLRLVMVALRHLPRALFRRLDL